MVKEKINFSLIPEKVKTIVNSSSSKNEKLRSVCELLRDSIPYYNWVGFYILDESKKYLALGPFVGEKTEHVKIPVGRGICGQAAEKKETFIVQDVSKETNYLSCSAKVRSEIVVPIFKNDEIIGELDIDSHTVSPFGDEDKKFLEKVCRMVSKLFQ